MGGLQNEGHRKGRGNMSDFENDEHDGALFRFWIRAGSQFPGETAKAITNATSPAEYRKALIELAARKMINLPPPPMDKRLIAAFCFVAPKPPAGFDLTDEFKVKAYDALRDALYREKSNG